MGCIRGNPAFGINNISRCNHAYPKREAEGNLRPKKRRQYEDRTDRFDDVALEDLGTWLHTKAPRQPLELEAARNRFSLVPSPANALTFAQ